MSFKAKIIFIVVFILVATMGLAGFLGYRESKSKVKELARELLVTKTDQGFALCDHHYKTSPVPSEELKEKIAGIRIARDGYIAVIGNQPGANKGVLVVHPENVGTLLYNEEYPHIKDIIEKIDAGKNLDGGWTEYRQMTDALGFKGQKKIGYFKYFEPWNWIILSTSYEKDVFASRDELRSTLWKLFVLVVLGAAVVVYVIIREMFKPVQRLTESTQEVAKGNWDISIDYKAKDEIGTLARSFEKMVRSLRENARMWHEFNVARDMQAEMLPKSQPEIEGLQIFAKSTPAKEVGGDFYDFLNFDSNKIGIVVGDVSGHSVSAAMVMTAAMGAMRFAAEDYDKTDEVLNLVNTRLNKDIQTNMFVALFYGILDVTKRQLHYTNAGQTMPFLWRAGEVSFLPQAEDSDRFPLGIVKSSVYEQLTLDLQSGDILIFYTDGVVEVMNGSYETFGFDRLSDSIRKLASLPPDEMVERLLADTKGYCGNCEFHDDITVVVVKVA
jgi:serine phosphatase RsbU (regulator of sigma subunit)